MRYKVYYITNPEAAAVIIAKTAESAAITFFAMDVRRDASQISVEPMTESKRYSRVYHYRACDLIHTDEFVAGMARRAPQEALIEESCAREPMRRTALKVDAILIFAAGASLVCGLLLHLPS